MYRVLQDRVAQWRAQSLEQAPSYMSELEATTARLLFESSATVRLMSASYTEEARARAAKLRRRALRKQRREQRSSSIATAASGRRTSVSTTTDARSPSPQSMTVDTSAPGRGSTLRASAGKLTLLQTASAMAATAARVRNRSLSQGGDVVEFTDEDPFAQAQLHAWADVAAPQRVSAQLGDKHTAAKEALTMWETMGLFKVR